MKVALVHDWLTGMRGGERCLEAFLSLYPDADIFTLLHVPGSTSAIIDERVHTTSFLNSLPKVHRYYRTLLPLYPSAIKSFSFEGYDLVVSLSHAAAKNISVPSGVPHISYCFTPMRYIWDQAYTYFGSLTPSLWPVLSQLRRWDVKGSEGVTHFVAISRFIEARIRCFYRRRSTVIAPPVDTSWITSSTGEPGEAFLYAGALVPYKRPDLVVQAFNQLGEKLYVVGTGPELGKLRAMAAPNITFRGYVSDNELSDYYRRCRALVFPAKEDFGMIPVECMAAGRPVIGLNRGGVAETVKGVQVGSITPQFEGATGVFLREREDPTVSGLTEAVTFFMRHEERFSVQACRDRALLFSPATFEERWNGLVEELMERRQ